jgi:thiamine kinase-like enzyme
MPDVGLEAVLPTLVERLGPVTGEPLALEGGITNRNFRVRFGGVDYVVRVVGKDTDLLGIDRDAERRATEAAASVGVGPQVGTFVAEQECLVTRFIPGRAITAEDLRRAGPLAQVAAALRAVHGGPALPVTFSPFRIVEEYRETAAAHGAAIPEAYDACHPIAHQIEAAFQGPEHAPVPCHNDLLTANFIDDGERIRIIDWEYAGMGDRFFDLGNLSINNGLDAAADERLVAAYFQEPATPARLASLRLMRIMSDFREAMWGVVQSAVSTLDLDYDAYAREHFDRLRDSAGSPDFDRWLQDAHGD